jgi:hypothetical protein
MIFIYIAISFSTVCVVFLTAVLNYQKQFLGGGGPHKYSEIYTLHFCTQFPDIGILAVFDSSVYGLRVDF